MRTLQLGDSGDDVRAWETFLVGAYYYWLEVDGIFSVAVEDATKSFQRDNGLTPDGTLGPKTYAVALQLGLPGAQDDSTGEEGPNWPPKPDFAPITAAEREQLFGKFSYVPAAIPGSPEAIRITDDWARQNIVQVEIPQLRGKNGAPASGVVAFHRRGAAQLKSLWQDWEDAMLLPFVTSFAGTWAPRFVRGSRTYLSNHSWATAFDINATQNALGATPALVGKPGSVRRLVELANQNGFYWGGHFARSDGMHFEWARVLE